MAQGGSAGPWPPMGPSFRTSVAPCMQILSSFHRQKCSFVTKSVISDRIFGVSDWDFGVLDWESGSWTGILRLPWYLGGYPDIWEATLTCRRATLTCWEATLTCWEATSTCREATLTLGGYPDLLGGYLDMLGGYFDMSGATLTC